MESREAIIEKVQKLISMHESGKLGGEIMPEDVNPNLPEDSEENRLFFTLPMALNYQRDSYRLWESATKAFNDPETNSIFDPLTVCKMDFHELQEKLIKYKVALQKNKHTEIWMKISETLVENYDNTISKLFKRCKFSINNIYNQVQKKQKKGFPYLSGPKICTYWLYVMEQYGAVHYSDRENLTIAPDTHVLQSSKMLGVINEEDYESANHRERTIQAWEKLLKGTGLLPIDVHTPLWLWSRNGFTEIC